MTLEEYADVLNLELRITRYSNQNNRYTARFEHCETKDDSADCCLTGSYGNGKSPSEAIADYLSQLRGRILVVNSGDRERRRQYVVPKDLRP